MVAGTDKDSLRGAAPLHWTLLHKRRFTGVSVQTLHPTMFDHGKVLAQTALPGVEVPEDANVKTLEGMLAPMGAQLLVQAICERRFLAPVEVILHSQANINAMTHGRGIQMAPKITPQDRHIDWSNLSNDDLLRRDRVLGQLYDTSIVQTLTGSSKSIRLICEHWNSSPVYKRCARAQIGDNLFLIVPKHQTAAGKWRVQDNKPAHLMRLDYGGSMQRVASKVYCTHMTIEGKPKHMAGGVLAEWLRKTRVFQTEYAAD